MRETILAFYYEVGGYNNIIYWMLEQLNHNKSTNTMNLEDEFQYVR